MLLSHISFSQKNINFAHKIIYSFCYKGVIFAPNNNVTAQNLFYPSKKQVRNAEKILRKTYKDYIKNDSSLDLFYNWEQAKHWVRQYEGQKISNNIYIRIFFYNYKEMKNKKYGWKHFKYFGLENWYGKNSVLYYVCLSEKKVYDSYEINKVIENAKNSSSFK